MSDEDEQFLSQDPAEKAVRLLRAKVSEWEAEVRHEANMHGPLRPIAQVRADLALIAGLLADHINRTERWEK